MNENEDLAIAQLERELRSLEPLTPDALLVSRLDSRLSAAPAVDDRRPARRTLLTPKPVGSFPAWRRWAPWAVAAAVTVAITSPEVFRRSPEPVASGDPNAVPPETNIRPATNAASGIAKATVAPQPRLVPLRSDRQVQGFQDAGYHYDQHNGLRRRVRFEFDNHQQFQDPRNGSMLELTFPTQEDVWIAEPIH